MICYIGFMVSVICDTETAATFMGIGSFFPLAMLSGKYIKISSVCIYIGLKYIFINQQISD